jgi:hypothetical protein
MPMIILLEILPRSQHFPNCKLAGDRGLVKCAHVQLLHELAIEWERYLLPECSIV